MTETPDPVEEARRRALEAIEDIFLAADRINDAMDRHEEQQ